MDQQQQRTKWSQRDILADARTIIEQHGTKQTLGQFLLRISMTWQVHRLFWGVPSRREFKKPGWRKLTSRLAYPKRHSRQFAEHVTKATIARYRELMALGVPEMEAGQRAVDEARERKRARTLAKRLDRYGGERPAGVLTERDLMLIGKARAEGRARKPKKPRRSRDKKVTVLSDGLIVVQRVFPRSQQLQPYEERMKRWRERMQKYVASERIG